MGVVRMVSRPAILAFLAMLAAAGCRTAGVGPLARTEPVPPRVPSYDVRELIADHNRNAEKVQTFEAKPTISISSGRRGGVLRGKLAMERPRNFKLELSSTMQSFADIGSNDAEFWFWVKDSKDKAIYVCNYDEAGESPLATSLQPDWIIEALGLRVISDREAAEITVKRGQEPDTLVLTHRPRSVQGTSSTRVTFLSESTRRIREHRIYAADGKTLLARAVVLGYQKVGVSEAADEFVYMPQRVKLDWAEEDLSLDVTLKEPKVNEEIASERREILFREPELSGYARKNLADQAGVARGPTTIRETRPAPPSRVRLGEPAPMERERPANFVEEPEPLSADLPPMPALAEQVVRPRIPTAPEPEFLQAGRSGWRGASSMTIER